MWIRWPKLQQRLDNVSRSTVDRWENQDKFPKRRQQGGNTVAWWLPEIEEWEQSLEQGPAPEPKYATEKSLEARRKAAA